MTREEAIEVYNRLINEKIKAAFEFFSPELRESEDERIRKVIYKLMLGMREEIFTSQDEIVTKEKVLAYLKKQEHKHPEWSEGEMKLLNSIIDDYEKAAKSFCGYDGKIGLLKAIRDGEYNLSKPAERKINEIIDAMNGEHEPGDIYSEDGRLIAKKEESEDERVCKRAIAILKQQRDYWSYDGPMDKFPPAKPRKDLVDALDVALSYLEKQKEPKDPFDDEQFSRGYEAGKHDALRGQVDAFVTEYNKGFEAGRLEGITAGYNKAVKEIEQKEPKPTWSEEDEKMLYSILAELANHICYNKPLDGMPSGTGWTSYKYQQEMDWLTNRLKSLRPGWKPTEEQMNALNFAITYFMHETNYKNPTELRDLYDDLLKLK